MLKMTASQRPPSSDRDNSSRWVGSQVLTSYVLDLLLPAAALSSVGKSAMLA